MAAEDKTASVEALEQEADQDALDALEKEATEFNKVRPVLPSSKQFSSFSFF